MSRQKLRLFTYHLLRHRRESVEKTTTTTEVELVLNVLSPLASFLSDSLWLRVNTIERNSY